MFMALQLLLNGIALGCVYGLVALGIAIIWSTVRTLNFAQGDIMMLGTYIAYTAMVFFGLSFWNSFVIMMIGTFLFGYIFQRIAYYPLRNRGFIHVVVATIGVSIFLRNFAQVTWGNAPVYFPKLFQGVIKIGYLFIRPQNIFIIVVITIAIKLFGLLLSKTKFGKMLRATAQDQITARLMGINVERMIILSFALSSFMAGIGGVLLAPLFFLEPGMGGLFTARAFIATVIGGYGHLTGAVIGGIIVGIVEVMCSAYISTGYKDVFVFGLAILFIIFRPEGIFGDVVGEKA